MDGLYGVYTPAVKIGRHTPPHLLTLSLSHAVQLAEPVLGKLQVVAY